MATHDVLVGPKCMNMVQKKIRRSELSTKACDTKSRLRKSHVKKRDSPFRVCIATWIGIRCFVHRARNPPRQLERLVPLILSTYALTAPPVK